VVAGLVEEAEEGDATTINHEGTTNTAAFFARMYVVLR
jgi:hypothetical protein